MAIWAIVLVLCGACFWLTPTLIGANTSVSVVLFLPIWMIYYARILRRITLKKVKSMQWIKASDFKFLRLKKWQSKYFWQPVTIIECSNPLWKANFSLIQGLYGQIKETAYLLLFAYPFFWSYSRQLANNYGFTGEYWETVCFLVVTTIFETIIGQPWKLYSTFVIEERHGFNKMTLGKG